MYLFCIKIFFASFMYNLSEGLESHEFVKKYEILDLNKNESSTKTDDPLVELLQEKPFAVVLELKEPLLEKVKESLDESEISFQIGRTILATFDSQGLQDVSVYNDTFKIRQAIMDLRPSFPPQREGFSPTIQTLLELLQKDISEGTLLLVTMSKPSDEDFESNFMRSLMGKKTRLSVLWTGNYPTDESLLLKEIAKRTGGKFRYIRTESDDEAPTDNFSKAVVENLSEQIKFPEEQKRITGEGAPFISKAENQRVLQKTVVPLIIEVASGSNLEARPGTLTQIQFSVKNNLNVVLPVVFNAKFNGVVQNVQPPQVLLQPAATVSVIINLQLLGSAQNINAVGTLTLTAIAANKATSRSAIISLTPQTVTDTTPPKMYHKYEGDCSNYREPQNCEQGHWSLEATIQDEDSGLLKILSEPYGLLFQSEFVAGTKSPVTVYYSATCCQPNTIIWAEDIKGNYVKKSFDVFNQNLLAGEIASIVLGVLFILFIIVAIIVAVIFIRRRNQRNMIIPRT